MKQAGDIWWDDDTWGGDIAWYVQMADGSVQQFWREDHAKAIAEVEKKADEERLY